VTILEAKFVAVNVTCIITQNKPLRRIDLLQSALWVRIVACHHGCELETEAHCITM